MWYFFNLMHPTSHLFEPHCTLEICKCKPNMLHMATFYTTDARQTYTRWKQRILTKHHITYHAVVLLTIKWSLALNAVTDNGMIPLLQTPQQRLLMLFHESNNLPKLPLPLGILTPSNIWLLGPAWVSPEKAPKSIQPFLVWPTHRYTDRPRYVWHLSQQAVHINAMHAMRPNNGWASVFITDHLMSPLLLVPPKPVNVINPSDKKQTK